VLTGIGELCPPAAEEAECITCEVRGMVVNRYDREAAVVEMKTWETTIFGGCFALGLPELGLKGVL